MCTTQEDSTTIFPLIHYIFKVWSMPLLKGTGGMMVGYIILLFFVRLSNSAAKTDDGLLSMFQTGKLKGKVTGHLFLPIFVGLLTVMMTSKRDVALASF